MDFESILSVFIDGVDKILKRIKITRADFLGIEISISEKPGSIDDRLKKLEIAKQNLKEGLTAIEELETQAEKNKKEVEDALAKINTLTANKNNLEEELKLIKQVISSDVNAFQKIAGVPTVKQIGKERILGFISGVIASVVASGIVWVIIKIVDYYSNHPVKK